MLELRCRYLFRDLGSIHMHILRSGYLSTHLWPWLVLELCLGELLRFHGPIGHGSLLSWHLRICFVKCLFQLRRGLLLSNDSIELYEL